MSKKIKLIIGTSRQERIAKPISDWVVELAKSESIDLEVIDLKELKLPFFDEPVSPMYQPVQSELALAWAKQIAEAEAFVFVTPEYNRSIPAILKNAIDYLYGEWNGKTATVVSYGYIDGGASAAKHLNDILGMIKISVVEPEVNIQLTPGMIESGMDSSQISSALESYKDSVITALKALNS